MDLADTVHQYANPLILSERALVKLVYGFVQNMLLFNKRLTMFIEHLLSTRNGLYTFLLIL